jgi:glycosyltransferase involved in cell wall biosynthesis
VDFRDLWLLSIHRGKLYARHPWRRAVEAWWERQIVRHASRIIVTTERSRQQLISKYGAAEKFTVITNGFDPEDFAQVHHSRPWPESGFHLTLTGNVESLFDATPFFRALHALVREDPEIHHRLIVHFVGTNLTRYSSLITSLGLDSIVRVHPYVPHSESVRFLQQSDALFLCQIPDPISAGSKLSGKLFEYMAAQKPILALTLADSLTADLLQHFGPGLVVQPDDEKGIKAALHNLIRRTGKAVVPVNEGFIRSFDRRLLTADLAALMHKVTEAAA